MVSSNFYIKVKVICTEIEYLKLTLKIIFKVVNIKYKFTNDKKVIDINNDNYFFSNKN